MSNTFGIGITTSYGEGYELGLQRAFIRDGATGQWFYAETTFVGFSVGALPVDGSIDVFVAADGVPASAFAGDAFFTYVSSIASSALIQNVQGQVIGVQGGLATNIGAGHGFTYTDLIPIDDIPLREYGELSAPILAGLIGLALFGPQTILASLAFGFLISPLLQVIRDPLVLDLDGDGIELSALDGSTVHFDYDRDGFAEKTGWVSADDGILAIDTIKNGVVDGASELFGSPDQDGFAVLETLDSNSDGKIDTNDELYDQLRVWRDLDQDGVSDAGELVSLAEAGIKSISLIRSTVNGLNNGHTIGFEAVFTRLDGSTGTTQSVYFQTNRQDTTGDHTPNFTPAEGVSLLPQLPGSGQINSIAWKATQDADFLEAWTDLTDQAARLSFDQLRGGFEALLLKWAGVDGISQSSRGQYVDAQHLAFVEKFFGSNYLETHAGLGAYTSPSTEAFGLNIEGSFDQIVDVLMTAFLAQVGPSVLQRGGELEDFFAGPYFAYALLNFGGDTAEGALTPGNLAQVIDFIVAMLPEGTGAAALFLEKALAGLNGMVSIAFENDREAYLDAVNPCLAAITDPVLRDVATAIVSGEAAIGIDAADGLIRMEGDNLFVGGKGDDIIVSGEGNDIFLSSKGDGVDYIRDTSTSLTETDTLLLTDRVAADVIFERIGDTLILRFSNSTDVISAEDFFREWGVENKGIDKIVFSDGSSLDRNAIAERTVATGTSENNVLTDTPQNDIIQGGAGDDQITINKGNDTIVYTRGDGFDVVQDLSGLASENDVLKLAGLRPSDVELSRRGTDLLVKIKATGEYITNVDFFRSSAGNWGIDGIQFDSGMFWDRAKVASEAWYRGDQRANSLAGSTRDDVLQGRLGNDNLNGSIGSDTYVWKKGDGNDTITEVAYGNANRDKLLLQDVRSGDVELIKRGSDLLVSIKSTQEVIEITNQFHGVQNIETEWNESDAGIESIEFSNGFVIDREKIMESVVTIGADIEDFFFHLDGFVLYSYFVDELGHIGDIYDFENGVFNIDTPMGANDIASGTDGDDVIGQGGEVSSSGHNIFDGRKGNDVLYGGAGHDTLSGGEGNDALYGGSDEDLLDGGSGDDTLHGDGGRDLLSGGDGADALFGDNGSDTLYDISSQNDQFRGGAGDDLIIAGLSGASGGDSFLYQRGDGNDVISDGSTNASETDRLVLGDINPADVELSIVGADLIIRVLSTGETITSSSFFDVYGYDNNRVGVDLIQFADGTLWDRAAMQERAWIRGTDDRDELASSAGTDNIFHGRGGDDVVVSALFGGSGNGSDTFLYESGDGNDAIVDESRDFDEIDTLHLVDLNAADVQLSRIGDDLLVRDLTTGQVITNKGAFSQWDQYSKGLEHIKFADGTILNRSQLRENAWLRGSANSDILQTSDTHSNVFVGGKGNDLMISAPGRGQTYSADEGDTFLYKLGDGNDTIYDGGTNTLGIDKLILEDINAEEVRLRVDGTNLVIEFITNDQKITDESAFWNRSQNMVGIDQIVFQNGTTWSRSDIGYWATHGSIFFAGTGVPDTIIGSYLDQRLSGAEGNDFIDGKGGNDLIFGDAGNDTLSVSVWNAGELDTLDGGANNDTVSLATFGSGVSVDLVAGQVKLRSTDALMATAVAMENITGTAFDDILSGDDGANTIVGGNGHDAIDGRSGNDVLKGEAGDDTVAGYIGNDTLEGGAGADTLSGGLGNDTYNYTRGDGADTISEGQAEGTADVLRLKSIDPTKVSFERSGADVIVRIAETVGGAGDSGAIRLASLSGAVGQYGQYGIDSVVFDNGTTWTADYLNQWSVYDSATDGDDILVGSGSGGDFWGRKGDDALNAAGGDDSYFYYRGDGHDVVTEDNGSGLNDRLVLKDINPSQISLERMGLDLKIVVAESEPGLGDNGSILLKNTLDNYLQQGVEKIVFANGTEWTMADLRPMLLAQASTNGNDTIVGFWQADVLSAGLGNDTVNGKTGNDVYNYARGDGNDVVVEESYSGADDKLVFANIDASDIIVVRNGTDVMLLIAASSSEGGDSGSILLKESIEATGERGIEKVVFSNGTVWTASDLISHVAYVGGTSANDTITGTSGANEIRAGLGNDLLTGLAGNDTYVYALGDGNDIVDEQTSGTDADTLLLTNIAQTNVSFERSVNDAVIRILATGETITLKNQFDQEGGVEKIVFGDGTVLGGSDWSLDGILQGLAVISGTSGDDTITGTTANDSFRGGLGNDTFNSGAGSDTYIYASGDGSDYINDESGSTIDIDVLRFTDLNANDLTISRLGVSMKIVVNATGQVITIDEQFYSVTANWGLEKFEFADGTSWNLTEINAAGWYRGTSGNDTITGSAWKDTILGREGNDTLSGAAGSDTYVYFSGDGSDTINDNSGATTEIDVLRFANLNANDLTLSRSGTDLKVAVNATGQVLTISYQFYSTTANWGVEKFEFSDGSAWNLAQINNAGWYRGTIGNDTITGSTWNDTIFGDKGNDTLSGGTGSDTFVFQPLFGKDTITDFTAGAGSADVIRLDPSIFADFSAVYGAASQVGSDTVITLDVNNTITLKNVLKTNLHADDFGFLVA